MRRINLIIIFLLFLIKDIEAQSDGVLPRIYGREHYYGAPSQLFLGTVPCETSVKVSDEKPNSCFFNAPVFYPVFIEDFTYKEDLPNNFEFSNPGSNTNAHFKDADGTTYDCGLEWYGDAYEHNITVTNGVANLLFKQENYTVPSAINPNKHPPAGCPSTMTYGFTSAMLYSLPRFSEGIFVARLKLADNPNFWPALWLFGTNPDKQEIDIFEHYDPDLSGSICDQYNQMKMTNHRYMGTVINSDGDIRRQFHCSRDSKFPVANNFFNSYHTYQLTFTDYRVLIYVDQILVGFSTRYYDNPWFNSLTQCAWKPNVWQVPNKNYDCVGLNNLSNSTPFGNNMVSKDEAFPSGTLPMNFIFGNGIYHPLNNLSGFSATDMQVSIDYMYVWQKFDCNTDKNICNLTTFFNQAAGTNYLTGRNITVGSPYNTCSGLDVGVAPVLVGNNPQYPNWKPHINMLAQNEIGIYGDAVFEEGTYFRAEIVDCGAPSPSGVPPLSLSQKSTSETQSQLTYVEPPENIEEMTNAEIVDNYEQTIYKKVSAINLYPNPTKDMVSVQMNEEDFNDLLKIEITDMLGQKFECPTSNIIDVKMFKPGVYFISFFLKDGNTTTKRLFKE